MLNELFEVIRKTAEGLLKSAKDFLEKNGKTIAEPLFKSISEEIKEKGKVLSIESIKIALSYHEFYKESITFEELLAIIKRDFTLHQGMSICILKTEKSGVTIFDIMACSAEQEILFAPSCPWYHIVVSSPDQNFLKMFNNKEMLVLK